MGEKVLTGTVTNEEGVTEMNKVTAKIDGMACAMCEAHIQEAIRKAFPEAKKVSASRAKHEATFLMETAPEEEKLAEAVKNSGYDFISMKTEPYEKKGFFGFGR